MVFIKDLNYYSGIDSIITLLLTPMDPNGSNNNIKNELTKTYL